MDSSFPIDFEPTIVISENRRTLPYHPNKLSDRSYSLFNWIDLEEPVCGIINSVLRKIECTIWFSNSSINNNVFESNYDIPMGITAVSQLSISDNRILTNQNDCDCMIKLKNCNDVTVRNNHADEATFNRAQNTLCQDNVKDIRLEDPICIEKTKLSSSKN